MSLHLGKIHYWLFNKILWFENLEENIVQSASEMGLDTEKARTEIEERYGKKLQNKNLEEIIDSNNIHGWLQNRIHTSEGRMAAWVSFILKNSEHGAEKLKEVFEKQGISAAEEANAERKYESAPDIYNCVNNYILDGMPCDRVNVVSVSEDNLVAWERRLCVHKDLWSKEGVDVAVFYSLRNSWLGAFVKSLNPEFEYLPESEGNYKIKKI
ncbi:MAG: hypothetical protein ACRCU6_04945 [Fusobacteriaceae bacterium]